MAFPLPIARDTTVAPASAFLSTGEQEWAEFTRRRDALVSRMEMATCDGCDGCGLRCMGGFTVTQEEYAAARAYLATLPAAEVARVLGQEKTVPWPGAEDTGATVTYCRFRDRERNNCFIYPARPTICRLFGHTPWLPCPIGAVQSVPDGSPQLWHEYLSFERRTWEEWDALFAAPEEPEENAGSAPE